MTKDLLMALAVVLIAASVGAQPTTTVPLAVGESCGHVAGCRVLDSPANGRRCVSSCVYIGESGCARDADCHQHPGSVCAIVGVGDTGCCVPCTP